jgi:hypothetical protein
MSKCISGLYILLVFVVALLSIPSTLFALGSAPAPNHQEGRGTMSNQSDTRYFTSPEDGVEKIRELLNKEDFATLAKYYDLNGSEIARADLVSGAFFINEKRPEVAHPAGFYRHKHPMDPSFGFSSKEKVDDKGVWRIMVEIRIMQGGDNDPVQIGCSFFHMLESKDGWQVLPHPTNETYGEEPEMPKTVDTKPRPDLK